jgi:hypothetical protein
VNVVSGETFFQAAKPIQPVNDAVRVSIDLGPVTEEKKRAVLTGALRLSDLGNAKVEVCKSKSECTLAIYSGPYFSRDSFGIGFEASGPQLKHSTLVGVKVTADRALEAVVIHWSNFSQ